MNAFFVPACLWRHKRQYGLLNIKGRGNTAEEISAEIRRPGAMLRIK
jgi:hypothetical protein